MSDELAEISITVSGGVSGDWFARRLASRHVFEGHVVHLQQPGGKKEHHLRKRKAAWLLHGCCYVTVVLAGSTQAAGEGETP